jgi:hypothetical protein
MKCTVEKDSGDMTYIQCFMKIGGGIQAILRFCCNSLKFCNVCITDGGRDL